MKTLLTAVLIILFVLLTVRTPAAAEVTDPAAVPTPMSTPPTVSNPPTPVPVLRVTGVEPLTTTAGRSISLSIYGEGFSPATVVRLPGYGALTPTLLSPAILTVTLPADVPAGSYSIELSDLTTTAAAPALLTVLQPTPTPPPVLPPTETPFPTATRLPPTPVPGQPALIVRAFRAAPETLPPGGTTEVRLEVFNAGNRPAESVVLTLNPEAAFTSAAGQGAVTLPPLPPGGAVVTALLLTARADAAVGSVSVPLTLRYRDAEGETFTAPASVSLTITPAAARIARPVVDGYAFAAEPALIGEPVRLTLNLRNRGTIPAEDVLVRVSGADGVLVSDGAGDTFAFGDLAPDAMSMVTLPLRVSSAAEPGVRTQTLSIQYQEAGVSREAAASVSVRIAAPAVERPLILLERYAVSGEPLTPGQPFTFIYTLHNLGAAASDLLLTIGPAESAVPPPGPTTTDSASGGSAATLPGTLFAPVGSGSTIFLGALGAGERAIFTQALIVNAGVSSGVQTLPLALSYRLSDGSSGQTLLSAALPVLVPPRLQVLPDPPLPDAVTAGEAVTVTLRVLNIGRNAQPIRQVELSSAEADIVSGAVTTIGLIPAGEDVSISGTLLPYAEGALTFTVRVIYPDELNRLQTLDYPYALTVLPAPIPEPPPEVFEPVSLPPPPTPPADLAGRLLLGLLGLGG